MLPTLLEHADRGQIEGTGYSPHAGGYWAPMMVQSIHKKL